jgi:uncharacterized membrane protein YphA (DoxX/SURF4 family)
MSSIALVVRLALALVFTTAALGKLADRPGARRALTAFGVPWRPAGALAVALPLAELGIAAALVPAATARAAALCALALIAAFCFGIVRAMRRGERPDCHCFGQLHSAPAGPRTLARNAALGALAGFVAVAGPGASSAQPLGANVGPLAIAAAVALGLAAVTLWRGNRDLLADLYGLRAGLGTGGPDGLPIGTLAPSRLDAGTLTGGRVAIADLHKRGRPLLLLFLDPDCPSCGLVIEQAVAWQRRLRERLEIVVISGVGPEQASVLVDEHGLAADSVLLQRRTELFDAFRITATPAATLVGTDGRISATTASTPLQIEVMVRMALGREPGVATAPVAG